METSLTKSLIRKTVLSYRKLLADHAYIQRNEALLGNLDFWLKENQVHRVHLFLSISANREPDVTPLLATLWKRDVRSMASVTDFKQKTMEHFYFDESTNCPANHLGIPEPVDGKRADLRDVQAILVPLLMADKKGYRIGYGGGFYDKLLSETKAAKIGLSLSNPVDHIRQTDDWDVPLNFLITPYKIYNYG